MAEIPTIKELKDEFLSDLETLTNKSAPLLPVSVWEILAVAVAGLDYQIYKFGQWVRRQIFADSADEEALLQKGLEYGLAPTEATRSIFLIEATGLDGTLIRSGSILTLNGGIFATTADATITTGVAIIEVESTIDGGTASDGSSLNPQVSDTLEFVNPPANLDDIATVTEIIQTGSDSEDIESFRRRLQFRQQLPPQGGAIPDYIIWATSVPGIAEAYIFRPVPGTINVFPLTTSTDFANRIPSPSKLAEVQAYIEDGQRKPLNDNPIALAFTNVGVKVTLTGLVPNTLELKSLITPAIQNYLLARRPRQFPDEQDAPNQITTSDIITVCGLSGAKFVQAALEFQDTTPFSNYTLEDNEIAYAIEVVYA